MNPNFIGIIGFVCLFLLLIIGTPIAIAMAVIGFAGFACIAGFDAALGMLRTVPYSTFANYNFSVIPLFMLMGTFCYYGGLSKDLYDAFHAWMGKLKGGLAMATIGGCGGFAAVCGSSLATAVAMGKAVLPEMKRHRYNDALATGSIAAGGSMGILIPPSTALIIYGIITEQSIGKLFLSGIIPGLLEGVFYIITIYIICKINPSYGPATHSISWKNKITSLKRVWVVLVLFILVIGGLYFGVFSPIEAGGVGAFGAFVFSLARKRLQWRQFRDSIMEVGWTTAMLMTILLGAMFITYFASVSRLPNNLAASISELHFNRYGIILIIGLLYLFMGCLMDPVAMILITVPILHPLVSEIGFDLIWFGIFIVRMSEIGMITPPIGLNVFVIKEVAENVPMETIFKGTWPFLTADVFHVILLIIFPQLCLFLPNMMK